MRVMQTSYASGVLAPSLHPRVDLAKWQIGVYEANNYLVHVHGGMSNRPGLYYAGTSLGANRKIPFEYSVDDAYALEFTDLKLDLLRNGAYVVYPATHDVADYLRPDTGDFLNLDGAFDASATVTTVMEVELESGGGGDQFFSTLGCWRRDSDQYLVFSSWDGSAYVDKVTTIQMSSIISTEIRVAFTGKDVDISTYSTASGLQTEPTFNIGTDTFVFEQEGSHLFKRDGSSFMKHTTFGGPKVRSFTYSESAVEVLNMLPRKEGFMRDSVAPRDYFNTGAVSNVTPIAVGLVNEAHPSAGSRVSLTSPFAVADLKEIRYVQREDIMYLTHQTYGEYKLIRYDHHDWEFELETYLPVVLTPSALAGVLSGGTAQAFDITYVVAALDAGGNESLPSDEVSVTYRASNSWEAGEFITLTWDVTPGADQYVVYKNSRGYFGYVGTTTTPEFKDDNISPDSADGPRANRDPFNGADNKPRAVGIHQQRKFYGGTVNDRQTLWSTVTGTMRDMSVSRPLKDTSAITAPLDSNQMNDILHLLPMKELVTITNNGILTLNSGSNSDSLSPTALRYDLQDATAGSYLRPIVSGNTILLVPDYRKGVKEMFFQIQANGFEGTNLEIMSNHLFVGNRIVDWAFQRDQDLVWCIMENGDANVLTYLREHDVVAWTTVDTVGDLTGVCVVRSSDRDIPYFSVMRNIDGADVYYSEFLTDRLPAGVLEDGIFMDAAITYDGAATDSFTGAVHLANETCVALADGNVIEGVEVDGAGAFTLPHEYSKVHLGIGYVADFETLDVNYESQDGSGFNDFKVITDVFLSLENTRGISVGPDSDNLTEVKFRGTEDYDAPTAMFTGKQRAEVAPQWSRNGRVHVRQSYPLPVTILSHTAEVQAGDE